MQKVENIIAYVTIFNHSLSLFTMYMWTCANSYGVEWSYIFTTDNKSKVAKHIRKNVVSFWDNYFSVCVELIEIYIQDKVDAEESGSDMKEYESDGPLFNLLEEFIESKYSKKKKISKDMYIEKITEFLSEMRSDDVIKSMGFWEESGNKEDHVYTLKKDTSAKIIKI